jgi:hypothetical protein
MYFPLLFKEGCHARRVMTGWLKHTFETASSDGASIEGSRESLPRLGGGE